ncbi:MAG: hypothetical protein U0Y10_27205 [Spirosomataceae bacterium]
MIQNVRAKALWLVVLVALVVTGCKDDYIQPPSSTSTTNPSTPTTPTSGFIGKFKGKLSGIIEIDPMYVEIAATSKADQVSVTLNFGNLGSVAGIIATINGNTITIAKQTVSGSEYSGSGTLTDKKLDFLLTEKNTTGTFGYVYSGTKQ